MMVTLFTVFLRYSKGGDYRASREANVYRLAEVSNAIIDQCVAQGVPFAREYGGCCWITVLSVVLRYHVHSMPAVKPDSSCCWVLILH